MDKLKYFFIGELLDNKSNPYEKAKIETNYFFSFFGFICFFSVFLIAFFIEAYPAMIPSGVSAFYCITHLFVLKFTKNIRISSIIFTVLIFTILFGNMYFNTNTVHFGGAFWMVILIFFAAFNLGKKGGIIVAGLSLIAYSVFAAFFLHANIISAAIFPKVIFYALGLEATIAVFIIYYLLNTFIKTNRQITEELKTSNQHLEAQNKLVNEQHHEKIIMLKEIHHRVKNNLQVVSSMLRLQSDKISSDEVKAIFDDAQHRIQAMALVHQRMYQTENLAKIDIETYIKQLATDLTSLHSTTQEINLDVVTNFSELNVKNIVPLGLIINELISNSLKHGIKSNGYIQLSFNKQANDLLFTYKDNGVGFKETTKKTGFGMELIEVFALQMDSTFHVKNEINKGLTYEFNIPLN
ncbi:MAG: sensor histidine kinase [Vicingaceae bacterium]|nr:sensor histidine kinase [Vicingaceae bacterium]